jgi:hypothetical protein
MEAACEEYLYRALNISNLFNRGLKVEYVKKGPPLFLEHACLFMPYCGHHLRWFIFWDKDEVPDFILDDVAIKSGIHIPLDQMASLLGWNKDQSSLIEAVFELKQLYTDCFLRRLELHAPELRPQLEHLVATPSRDVEVFVDHTVSTPTRQNQVLA